MKHVGEAVKEQEITFGSEDKVNVIGIATWGIVDRKDSLKASKVSTITFKGRKSLIMIELKVKRVYFEEYIITTSV